MREMLSYIFIQIKMDDKSQRQAKSWRFNIGRSVATNQIQFAADDHSIWLKASEPGVHSFLNNSFKLSRNKIRPAVFLQVWCMRLDYTATEYRVQLYHICTTHKCKTTASPWFKQTNIAHRRAVKTHRRYGQKWINIKWVQVKSSKTSYILVYEREQHFPSFLFAWWKQRTPLSTFIG